MNIGILYIVIISGKERLTQAIGPGCRISVRGAGMAQPVKPSFGRQTLL